MHTLVTSEGAGKVTYHELFYVKVLNNSYIFVKILSYIIVR